MAQFQIQKREIDVQVDDLCENFGEYLAKFNGDPLYNATLCKHKKTLRLREKLGGVAESIDSDDYLCALYSTLEAWGMNSRRANLQEYNKFADQLRKYKNDIAPLDRRGLSQIDENDEDIARELWRIIQALGLSQTQSQMVTGAKTLHHLLPRLLPPIDGEYTRPFFRYYDSVVRRNPGNAFTRMHWYFARIAQRVELGDYVETAPWATSESKLIDNAIIGFCRLHPGLHKYRGRGKANATEDQAHIAACQLCDE